MKLSIPTIAISILTFCTLFSCRKHHDIEEKCTSSLLGYTAPSSISFNLALAPCSYGVINESGATLAPTASLMGYVPRGIKGTYNPSDRCYYSLQPTFAPPFLTLLTRVDPSGAVTALPSSDSSGWGNLVYDRANNKFYCTSFYKLGEITMGARSYSVTPLATSTHWLVDIAADPVTGDVYFTGVDSLASAGSYLQKYHPGSTTLSTVAHYPGGYADLNFNKNDRMLYALGGTMSSVNLVRINPASGATTVFSSVPQTYNGDFHSSALDPCTNRFIYSTLAPTSAGDVIKLVQLDVATGSLIRVDTLSSMYQGLEVAY